LSSIFLEDKDTVKNKTEYKIIFAYKADINLINFTAKLETQFHYFSKWKENATTVKPT
jgi:hypothetical protein